MNKVLVDAGHIEGSDEGSEDEDDGGSSRPKVLSRPWSNFFHWCMVLAYLGGAFPFVRYKVAETRPIPTPNNEQLEELTVLTDRARSRARARRDIKEDIQDIMDEKEAIVVANPYWYITHRDQLANMDRDLAFLDRKLNKLQAEEERDAAKERMIWKQVV
ncbi:unnamed protein product [Penicillium viridicatum]